VPTPHKTPSYRQRSSQALVTLTDAVTAKRRIRQAVSMRVRELKVVPQLPPDLLGILVLLPVT
jgi:hypothetical protein